MRCPDSPPRSGLFVFTVLARGTTSPAQLSSPADTQIFCRRAVRVHAHLAPATTTCCRSTSTLFGKAAQRPAGAPGDSTQWVRPPGPEFARTAPRCPISSPCGGSQGPGIGGRDPGALPRAGGWSGLAAHRCAVRPSRGHPWLRSENRRTATCAPVIGWSRSTAPARRGIRRGHRPAVRRCRSDALVGRGTW